MALCVRCAKHLFIYEFSLVYYVAQTVLSVLQVIAVTVSHYTISEAEPFIGVIMTLIGFYCSDATFDSSDNSDTDEEDNVQERGTDTTVDSIASSPGATAADATTATTASGETDVTGNGIFVINENSSQVATYIITSQSLHARRCRVLFTRFFFTILLIRFINVHRGRLLSHTFIL